MYFNLIVFKLKIIIYSEKKGIYKKSGGAKGVSIVDEKGEEENHKKARKKMGVEKQLLRPGTGPKPIPGQNVTVHCTGFGQSFSFSLFLSKP